MQPAKSADAPQHAPAVRGGPPELAAKTILAHAAHTNWKATTVRPTVLQSLHLSRRLWPRVTGKEGARCCGFCVSYNARDDG